MNGMVYKAYSAIQALGIALREEAGLAKEEVQEVLFELARAVLAYQMQDVDARQSWLMCFLVPELELCRVVVR